MCDPPGACPPASSGAQPGTAGPFPWGESPCHSGTLCAPTRGCAGRTRVASGDPPREGAVCPRAPPPPPPLHTHKYCYTLNAALLSAFFRGTESQSVNRRNQTPPILLDVAVRTIRTRGMARRNGPCPPAASAGSGAGRQRQPQRRALRGDRPVSRRGRRAAGAPQESACLVHVTLVAVSAPGHPGGGGSAPTPVEIPAALPAANPMRGETTARTQAQSSWARQAEEMPRRASMLAATT